MGAFIRGNVNCDEPGCARFTSAMFDVSDGFVGEWDAPAGWSYKTTHKPDGHGGTEIATKYFCPAHRKDAS